MGCLFGLQRCWSINGFDVVGSFRMHVWRLMQNLLLMLLASIGSKGLTMLSKRLFGAIWMGTKPLILKGLTRIWKVNVYCLWKWFWARPCFFLYIRIHLHRKVENDGRMASFFFFIRLESFFTVYHLRERLVPATPSKAFLMPSKRCSFVTFVETYACNSSRAWHFH